MKVYATVCDVCQADLTDATTGWSARNCILGWPFGVEQVEIDACSLEHLLFALSKIVETPGDDEGD